MTEKQDHKENVLPGRFCISLVEDSLLCFERIVENPHATTSQNVLELWLIIHPLARGRKKMEKNCCGCQSQGKGLLSSDQRRK
jgi:hypothetical protein